MSSNRPQRVGDLIQRVLAELLQREIKDPRIKAATITAVDVSPDLANAKIFITVMDEATVPATLKALNGAAGFLRRELAEAIDLRITPKLHFVYDESISRADKISKLIDEALQTDKPFHKN